jgi:two-component system sensor histidine kinase KdpD
LLRRGSRLAGRLNTDWFVVYVETPSEAPHRIDATAQRHLHTNIGIARDLGAEVVRLRGGDPVRAILDFARGHGVAHLIVGRSQQPAWKRVFGRDVVHRLIEEASDFDIHIASHESGAEREAA